MNSLIWVVGAPLAWLLAALLAHRLDEHQSGLLQRLLNVVAIVMLAVAWQQGHIHWGAIVFPLAALRVKPSVEGSLKTLVIGSLWVAGWWLFG